MKIEIIDAGHGDCILVTCGEILILIDSGPKSFKISKLVVDRLKNLLNGKVIDIAVVTHNDDDHIGGFRSILDSGIQINKFIFNSLSYISKVLKVKFENKQISYRQDIELDKLLKLKKIEIVSLNASDMPFFYKENLKITPLTPEPSVLLSVHNEAIKKNKQISKLRKKELPIAECLNLIKEGKDIFEKDRSLTNKSSLSLILEYKNKCALFLGDSHEEDVVTALKCSKARNFDFVKLSHHGSEKNTSAELISLIGKTEYILCGDKSSHAHPNRKTICRILNFDDSPKIHLSASNVDLKEMFDECKHEGFEIDVSYPTNKVNRVIYE